MRIRLPGAGRKQAPQEESLRRVAGRLAAITVALLLVMLLALEAIVYVTTQHALQGTLENTLKVRAGQADGTVCQYFHLDCNLPGGGPAGGGNGSPPPPNSGQGSQGNGSPPYGGGQGSHGAGSQPNGGGGGGQGPPPGGTGGGPSFGPVSVTSEASAVYVNRKLAIIHADAIMGNVLLDPTGLRRAIATGREQCCSVANYKGTDFLVYSVPLRNPIGKIVGGIQTSISEHQYEQTLQSLSQVLFAVTLIGLAASAGVSTILVSRTLQPIRRAMQRQRDFVADAAHELRTPLAIQRTVGEIGMAEPSAEELHATVEQMLGENRHLTRLVEDLSLLARTDTDAITIEHRPVDLSALVDETAQELSYLAADRDMRLDSDVQSGITVSGDILRLRQLLLILLDNALKHTPAGGDVRVTLTSDGTRARLQVADSGPGIPTGDLARVFDRFYRADQARTREGTGLGLAIAKWIVDAHGGRIQAANGPAGGAVFNVTLPKVAPTSRSTDAAGS